MEKLLIFTDFIVIFTEWTKNEEFSQKCPVLSHLKVIERDEVTLKQSDTN